MLFCMTFAVCLWVYKHMPVAFAIDNTVTSLSSDAHGLSTFFTLSSCAAAVFPVQTSRFIHEGRTSGGGCLVHCFAGVSRSASIVMAYLIDTLVGVCVLPFLFCC
jgi:hypothetical protein